MEASFKSRVDQVFGGLLGSSSQGTPQLSSIAASSAGGADSWSVSEVAIPCNQGSRGAEESSGSESDEPCAARYAKFVKLAKRARREQPIVDVDDELDDLNDVNDLEELNELDGFDDVDEGSAPKRRRREEPADPVAAEIGQEGVDEEEECRQVRLMVGMDDTLDFEEEEDEYDKVAVGREGAGERVYMREITGGSSDLSPHTPLPVAVSSSERRKFRRDSRANHAAAAARLEEDDRLATIKTAELARLLSLSSSSGSVSHREPSGSACLRDSSAYTVNSNGSSHLPGPSSLKSSIKPALKMGQNVAGDGKTHLESSQVSTVSVEGTIGNGVVHHNSEEKNLKGGNDLKDGEDSVKGTESKERNDSRASGGVARDERVETMERKSKRVRFAVDDDVIPKESASGRDTEMIVAVRPSRNRYGRVPDHVLNPSKYTHYTLDWSDEEDENKANVAAFQAARAMARVAEELETMDAVGDLPKSITFTPRSGGASNKSNGVAKPVASSGLLQSQALVSFAEEVVIDHSAQPEDASELGPSGIASTESRSARVFRKRAREEEIDNDEED